jgi:hypothetical protein
MQRVCERHEKACLWREREPDCPFLYFFYLVLQVRLNTA